MKENKQTLAMRKLGMSDEEIADVLKSDAEIDHGAKHFELSNEQKQAEKKARATGGKTTVYKLEKRERKADNDKRFLIDSLMDAVKGFAQNVNLINPEREFEFLYNEKRYKIVMSMPREKKG